MNREPIAIIGIGCRYPGARGTKGFWQLITSGVDAVTEVPPERWDTAAFYDPDPKAEGKMSTRWGGFLDNIDLFDPQFFKIAPREADSLDPQQRLLLEVTWEALEDAGQVPEKLAGTKTGVFVGISAFDYYTLTCQDTRNIGPYFGTGNTHAVAANRLSYVFDFRGPSIALDTACSSSLVATHLGCQSLRSGEATLAVAGGAHLILYPWLNVAYSKAGLMSPVGRCKSFDASADGYVRSEGAGIVVLKLLSQALADGDRIYAIIRGSAVNQDGRSNGLTAPNPKAQEAVLRAAYADAEIDPSTVQYIEAHGSGTKLGDPLEMKSLASVIGRGRSSDELCWVGAVKSNIGHPEAAAGVAGLIKTSLSLHSRQIPPSIHFENPNPYIPFDKIPLRVPTALMPWPDRPGPALAGVSAFGFGGTNAHLVLEEAPSAESRPAGDVLERPLNLLTLRAKSERALRDMAGRYRDLLDEQPELSLADLCYSANTGRSNFPQRLAVSAQS
ncbi:MAG: polyketide synthase, partial [Myxococcota bacterium]